MALEDIAYVTGKTLLGMGVPTRKNTSPLATGIASGFAGAANAIDYRRKKKASDKETLDRNTIEAKIGVPYEFFLKLSDEAQREILRNAGIMAGAPADQPIGAFGDRSLNQLETQGAPAREGTVPGGSGVFLGLPDATVQTGPPLPPLKALGATGRTSAVNEYLGLGGEGRGISPKDQSLIDYRIGQAGRAERRLVSTLETDRARRKQIKASTAALKALKVNREKPDAPVPAFMLDVARQMGVMIPKEIGSVTRKDFDTLVTRFPKPVMAVVSRIQDLSYAAREAELARGTNLTDKEIESAVRNGTVGLETIAKDPMAVGIVVSGVKKELMNLRSIPGLVKKDGVSEPDATADEDGNGIPDILEGDEEDFEEDEEDYSEPR